MGPLAAMSDKLGARLILHPPIGGRFTGLTEVALIPAALCGFSVEEIFNGAQGWFNKYSLDNDAASAASIFYQLEEQGIVDVYLPVYDHHLVPFSGLIVQLCHESFGKDGKGQTYFASEAPEAQHHTNQRFLGGQKNIAGWFIGSDKPLVDLKTSMPEQLKTVRLKERDLKSLENISLSNALRFEMEGTLEDARMKEIPLAVQTLTQRTPEEVGSLIAFWQLYSIYASCWRQVNPFDQPEVENSKNISFAKRLGQNSQL
jgi:glucose-6-phosphate isomerase